MKTMCMQILLYSPHIHLNFLNLNRVHNEKSLQVLSLFSFCCLFEFSDYVGPGNDELCLLLHCKKLKRFQTQQSLSSLH
jgi:hypothetical protein